MNGPRATPQVDRPSRACWTSTGPPIVTVRPDGQLTWAPADDDAVTDHETRSSPAGTITLRHVWNRDRTRLTRILLEASWADGPLTLAEARRPHHGWRGDELARLTLAVLTCCTMGT